MTSAALVLRLIFGLFIVFSVMAVLATLVRRSRGGMLRMGRRAPTIETLARVSLSKAASVAVLRVGERELLVGVGANSAHTEVGGLPGAPAMPSTVPEPAALPAGTSADPALTARVTPGSSPGDGWWPTFLEQARQRTVRTTKASAR